MLQSMLTDQQAELLRVEKNTLAETRLVLAELDVPREALDTLQKAILQLDELFLLVVVGEFNAGKSALMNALLGDKVLAEGVLPTTARITLVKWGDTVKESVVDEAFATFTHPLPLLRELNIVDTPGTNAVIRQHERLTNEFVPRSDLVLFVTSADRPMTESERQFMERLRDWGKKVIIALNKIDIFDDEASLAEVRAFVLRHAEDVLGFPPEYFPVSAKYAQQARTAAQPEAARLRAASRLDALEQYIYTTLDDVTRLQLKFTNPLGVASNIIEQSLASVREQEQALQDDHETVTSLDTVLAAYQQELDSELGPRLAEVENILHRLQARGLDFFDNTLRVTNILELTRGDAVRVKFEQQVLADVPAQIEDRIRRLIDWLVDKDLSQWQQVMSYLQKRQARYADSLVGEGGGATLDTRRRALIDTVGTTAHTIVDTYDREKEARELAASVETTVVQVAALGAGAVGLGALVLLVITSSAIDITGTLAAGTLAILGLFVIPYRRKQAKDQFRLKMETLRAKLLEALTTQFKGEAESALARLNDGVAPYTRFVKAERARVEKTQIVLEDVRRKISELRGKVGAMK